jgi:hypothetical protein
MNLEIIINNIEVLAVPDTGANINALSLSTLEQLRRTVDHHDGEMTPLRTARGAYLHALYQVMLPCYLPTPMGFLQTFHVVFHVFDKLASNVDAIVGCEFLENAQIFTKRSYLLRERRRLQAPIPTCMSIEANQTRVFCRGLKLNINGAVVLASSDTGSEINLVSKDLVRAHRLPTLKLTDEDDIEQVQFADGETARIIEKVIIPVTLPTVDSGDSQSNGNTNQGGIEYQHRQYTKVTPADARSLSTFYIVDGLVHEVILGQPLLHAVDAFGRNFCAFESTQQNSEFQNLCTIFKLVKKKPTRIEACNIFRLMRKPTTIEESELEQRE